ncbi:trehalase family glycosidase [Shigella flexneri]
MLSRAASSSETYYWDSSSPCWGWRKVGKFAEMHSHNFAWIIETYGHIPNGNRTYSPSESQPPVFALMVELFEEDGVRGARRYLDHLKWNMPSRWTVQNR